MQQLRPLALNGTTNTGGSLTTPSVVGTTIISTQLPLTAANALDVWNPVGSNRTSAYYHQIPHQLQRYDKNQMDSFTQFKLAFNGPVFELPAGPVKAAIGGEAVNYGLVQKVTKTNATGPSSFGSGFSVFHFPRSVRSVFAEIDVPVISPEMNVPLVNKFEVDVSGRYDDYSDVGDTRNLKFAADWTVIPGLKLRGSYSTSFRRPTTGQYRRSDAELSRRLWGRRPILDAHQLPDCSLSGDRGCPAGLCSECHYLPGRHSHHSGHHLAAGNWAHCQAAKGQRLYDRHGLRA